MKRLFSFLNTKTRLFFFLPVTTIFILSCEKDNLTHRNETNSQAPIENMQFLANAESYFIENPSIIPDLNFVIEYRDSVDSTNGLMITKSGKIIEYRFVTQNFSTLSPGSYIEIMKYFDDAHIKYLFQTNNSPITYADSIALKMMDDYDKITDSITFCSSVPLNYKCNIYQIQHASINKSCYPMRILEGEQENYWYVASPHPAQILSYLDLALSENGGLNMIYWEHYGFDLYSE